jgi:hypothetical protein
MVGLSLITSSAMVLIRMSASSNKFVMRVDDKNPISAGARGRDSVRIVSMQAYGVSMVVLQLTHMPEGCATWPAFWSLSAAGPWPKGGEIDIIEGTYLLSNFDLDLLLIFYVITGVNLNTENLASLHTSPDCSMPSSRRQCGYGLVGSLLWLLLIPALGRRYPQIAM